MTSKYGCFSEPGYVSIGDPYPTAADERRRARGGAAGRAVQGLNFKASSQKTGKVRSLPTHTQTGAVSAPGPGPLFPP